MEVIHGTEAIRKACEEARRAGRTVGFVPTMGALHEGHRELIRTARRRDDVVVVSIFVNPLQFGEGEDFERYPRPLERDLGVCDAEGVDLVFAPDAGQMLSSEPQVTVDPGPVGDTFEGASRPGHFRGVCTIVAKLFGLVGPCTAYFGEKDAQQVFLVTRMVLDLDMPVTVARVPTVREPDGLALSSRNAYLSPEERRAASCLHRGLEEAKRLVARGEHDIDVLRAAMTAEVRAEPLAELDYAAVVAEESFVEVVVASPELKPRAVIAARVGTTRLIDTMALAPEMPEDG